MHGELELIKYVIVEAYLLMRAEDRARKIGWLWLLKDLLTRVEKNEIGNVTLRVR